MDLGLNSDLMKFEVALEILGQSRQRIFRVIRVENEKDSPSAGLIKYCEKRIFLLDNLQDDLTLSDNGLIEEILNKDNRLAWL